MRRIAATVHGVEPNVTVRVYNDPTIGEIYSLRQKGAIVARLVIERNGTTVTRRWITTAGWVLCERTDFNVQVP